VEWRRPSCARLLEAQVLEIRAALELITDERHANNVSLASIIAQRRGASPF